MNGIISETGTERLAMKAGVYFAFDDSCVEYAGSSKEYVEGACSLATFKRRVLKLQWDHREGRPTKTFGIADKFKAYQQIMERERNLNQWVPVEDEFERIRRQFDERRANDPGLQWQRAQGLRGGALTAAAFIRHPDDL